MADSVFGIDMWTVFSVQKEQEIRKQEEEELKKRQEKVVAYCCCRCFCVMSSWICCVELSAGNISGSEMFVSQVCMEDCIKEDFT